MLILKRWPRLAAGLILLLATISCQDAIEPTAPPAAAGSISWNNETASFIVQGNGGVLPPKLAAKIAELGGTVTGELPQIGVAFASGATADFAAQVGRIPGVEFVVRDVRVQWIDPGLRRVQLRPSSIGYPPNSGTGNFIFDLQWAATAIDLPGAFNAGYRGSGVRVAVLDNGIDPRHPDLAPNVNVALSTSFIPGETFDSPPGWHGTPVSAIIAATPQDIPGFGMFGMLGVAPEAEIVMVKVLGGISNMGTFAGLINGLVYAADIGAHVVNMSLGAQFPRRGFVFDPGTPEDPAEPIHVGAEQIALLVRLTQSAVNYAHGRGATLVAAAMNDALNRDRSADWMVLPADLQNVISVSATAPIGWALDPDGTNFDRLASYSNYGRSRITLAAPGGDFAYPGEEECDLVLGFPWIPCGVLDLVISAIPCEDDEEFGFLCPYTWGAGTSLAAPHVSGVAALIIGKHGGQIRPTQVAAVLRASADKISTVGNSAGKTAAFGFGRVNAAKAVQ